MRKKTAVVIFLAVITAYVFCLSSPLCGEIISGLQAKPHGSFSPIRITFNSEGNLIVSEYKRGLIVTLDRNTLGVTGWFPIDGKPLAVACVNDFILVGNETRACLEAYKKNGRKLPLTWTPVEKPIDMAVDTDLKQIFVVDGGQKAVKVFSYKARLLYTIPASPPNNDVLANPTGIALDTKKREVYVGDYGDQAAGIYARVRIFDYQGNLTGTISGKLGMFGQRFSRPQGLAIDGKGHLLMIDCYSAEIMVFELQSGALLKTFGEYGSEPGQLRLPYDLVFDPLVKEIFVTNNRCSRIEVFRKVRGF